MLDYRHVLGARFLTRHNLSSVRGIQKDINAPLETFVRSEAFFYIRIGYPLTLIMLAPQALPLNPRMTTGLVILPYSARRPDYRRGTSH